MLPKGIGQLGWCFYIMSSRKSAKDAGSASNLQKSNNDVLELTSVLRDDGSVSDLEDAHIPRSHTNVLVEIDRLVGEIGTDMPEKKGKKETGVVTDGVVKETVSKKSSSNTATAKKNTSTAKESSDQQDEGIISKEKAAEIQAVLNVANRTENSAIGDITIKELVTEAMKPMLKDWIDNNIVDVVRDVVTNAVNDVVKDKKK